jgi:adenylate kinase
MNKNCVLTFVVGVSGVGKTTMIRRFVTEHSNYVHLEASKLIQNRLNAETTEHIRIMTKEQIVKNQSFLLDELSKYKQNCNSIILDGHLLINNNKELISIPLDIVRKIAPSNIVLLEGNSHDILLHRIYNPQKKCFKETISEIDRNQQLLKQIAIGYCKELGIRFDTLDFSEYKKFSNILSQIV